MLTVSSLFICIYFILLGRIVCMHRCGLLQQISHVVRSACLSVSVCALVKRMYCAKTAEMIEMPFGGLTHVGTRYHVLDAIKIGRIHSQPQEVTCWRCGLLTNYFVHVYNTVLLYNYRCIHYKGSVPIRISFVSLLASAAVAQFVTDQ